MRGEVYWCDFALDFTSTFELNPLLLQLFVASQHFQRLGMAPSTIQVSTRDLRV